MRITYVIALTCTTTLLAACSGKTTFGAAVDGLEGAEMGSMMGDGSQGESSSSASNGNEGQSTETSEQILENTTGPSEGSENADAVLLQEEPGSETPEGEEPKEEVPEETTPPEETEPPEETPPPEEKPPEYRPCAGKACGASCSTCAPDDEGCVETDVVRTCNAEGACTVEASGCGRACENADQCAVQTFAPSVCRVCSDGNLSCDGVACVEGRCVVRPAEECEPRECEEASQCRTEGGELEAPPESACKECPGGGRVCPEPGCTENQCVEKVPACPEEPKECGEGVECPQLIGAPCTLCDDGTAACPTTECVEGRCVSRLNECPNPEEYDPCAEKECGESCSQCDPENASCVEIQILQACNADGRCVARTEDGPVCPE